MFDSIRNVLFASLGLVALTTDKLKEAIEDLVRRGELSAEQGRRLVEELLARGRAESRSMSQKVAEEVMKVLNKSPFASRRDVQGLEARVRLIEERVGLTAPDVVLPGPEAAESAGEGYAPGSPGAV